MALLWANISANKISLNKPFVVVPALHSVLFHFTHQVTSGYSISLIRDPARGTSQLYLLVAWTSAFKQFFISVRKSIRLYPETVLRLHEIDQSFEESLRRGKLVKKLKVFLMNNDLHNSSHHTKANSIINEAERRRQFQYGQQGNK